MSAEIQDDIIKKIEVTETRVETLHTLLSGYITDMKGYVAPEIESQMMRVDRNDIWYNMMQIEGEVENASNCKNIEFRRWQFERCAILSI